MKKLIAIFVAVFVMISLAYAVEPTPNSKPLPTVKETQNPDVVITEQIQQKIASVPALKNQAISAAFRQGKVTLEGSVETKSQEQAAINAVKSVKGVKTVKSQLSIGKHGQ